MSKDKPLVSVVLSFRNEEKVLTELLRRIRTALAALPVCYEILFVNDASTDQSLELLTSEAAVDRQVKVLTLSRRFGVPASLRAGLEHAVGDAVITMDADLQDPPELIGDLIHKWQQGFEVVYTVRTARQGENLFKMLLTRIGYKIIRLVNEAAPPEEAGDFRLLSRRALSELLKYSESSPYYRGLVGLVGLKQIAVPYVREKRFAGKSHFPMISRGPIETFLSGIVSFSSVPLNLFLILGLLIFFTCLIVFILGFVLHAAGHGWQARTWFCLFVLWTISIQITGIGVLGLYLSVILKQTQKRPEYIISSTLNL